MTLGRTRWLPPLAATLFLLVALFFSTRLPRTFLAPPSAVQWTSTDRVASVELDVEEARKAMLPEGALISVWGDPRDGGARRHQGEDLAAPLGTPIHAPLDMVIYENGWNRLGGWTVNGRDALGRRWYFAHLREPSTLQVDAVIKAGDVIGYVGNTGNATNTPPHLHYQVSWPNGDWGNPAEVLRDDQ